MSMRIRLHAGAVINVEIGEEGAAVDSPIGVRQGPIPFLFITQAALGMVEWPVTRPTFRTRTNGVTPGGGLNRKSCVASFELFGSLFVDGFAIFFETREDMVTGKLCLFKHLRKFGLEIHVGSGTTASKTEAPWTEQRESPSMRPGGCFARRPGGRVAFGARAWRSSPRLSPYTGRARPGSCMGGE